MTSATPESDAAAVEMTTEGDSIEIGGGYLVDVAIDHFEVIEKGAPSHHLAVE